MDANKDTTPDISQKDYNMDYYYYCYITYIYATVTLLYSCIIYLVFHYYRIDLFSRCECNNLLNFAFYQLCIYRPNKKIEINDSL